MKQPSPVPSVRLSIRTPPTPARQTSIPSDTGSFVLKSPFVFGDFQTRTITGTDSRRVSDMIQESLDLAYQAGRRDGSRFGFIGGSRLGSVHDLHSPLPTTSQLVRNQEGLNDPSF